MTQSCLSEPYLFNDLLEDDQFARNIARDDAVQIEGMGNSADAMKSLTGEAVKMQLNEMFNEVVKGFSEIKHKLT